MTPATNLLQGRPYTPSCAHEGNPDYLREKFRAIRERLEALAEAALEEAQAK